MRTLELDLLGTLALATLLYFLGQFIVRRSAFLQRYSIPVPVVGGVLFAFFATLGLGADVRSLARGGWKLVILIGLFVALMIMQGAIGLAMARALDLHPLVGLLGGSISLIGGHGTAAAYATSFTASRNLQGALELGMAAATAGLILGSLRLASRRDDVHRVLTGVQLHVRKPDARSPGRDCQPARAVPGA